MAEQVFFILTVATAVGCALIAGVFLAFSNFVMRALARLSPEAGIAAMQSINITVINPIFLGTFLGTGLVGAVVAGRSLIQRGPGTALLVGGALLYIVGTIGVTMAFNVPRNNVLERADPASAEGARIWADYLRTWTAWNHVRTVCAGVAGAMFTVALAGE